MKKIVVILSISFLFTLGCQEDTTSSNNGPDPSSWSSKFGIQEAHYSYFGINDPTIYDEGTTEEGIAMFDHLDDLQYVKNFRYTLFWIFIEMDADGTYDWDRHDQLIDHLRSKNIEIQIMIGDGNSMYQDNPEAPKVSEGDYHQAWLNFIKAAVTRYSNRVNKWEIWNEPDGSAAWDPEPNPKEFSDFLKSTVNAIRDIQPNAFITMGGITGMQTNMPYLYGSRQFLKECFDEGVLDYVNAVGIHPYRSKPEGPFDFGTEDGPDIFYWPGSFPLETSFEDEIDYIRSLISGYKPGIELWNTESAYFNGSYPADENIEQAKFLSRSMLVEHAAGLKGLTHLRLRVNHQFPPHEPKFQGLIEDGDPDIRRIGFTAYQNIANFFGPSSVTHQRTINTTGKILGVDNNIRIEIYSKDNGKPVIAYWLPNDIDDTYNVQLIDVEIEGIDNYDFNLWNIFLDAPEANTITGTVNGSNVMFSNLPVIDYPLILYVE